MSRFVETSDANIAFMAKFANLGYRARTSRPRTSKPYDRPESSQQAQRRMEQSELLREASAASGGRVGRTIYEPRKPVRLSSGTITSEAAVEAARILKEEEELDSAGELYLIERSAHAGALKPSLPAQMLHLQLPITHTTLGAQHEINGTPELSPSRSSRVSSPATSLLSMRDSGLSDEEGEESFLPVPPAQTTIIKVEDDEVAQDAEHVFALYLNDDLFA